MKTDPSADPRKRILLSDDLPGPFKILLGYFLDKTGNIVSSRTGSVAGRGFVFIKRALGPPCPCLAPIHMSQRNGDGRHL
jgi:hypothetical protein